MNAPKDVKPSELRRLLDDYFIECCVLQGRTYYCRNCGSPIRYTMGEFEIHDEKFPNHSGPGKVERLMLPYCLHCEGFPDAHGCIHVNIKKHDGVKYEKPCDRDKKESA